MSLEISISLQDLPRYLAKLQGEVQSLQARLDEIATQRLPSFLSRAELSRETGIPVNTLKQYLSNRRLNGLEGAVVKRGRSVSIDVAAFTAWLRQGGPERHAAVVKSLRGRRSS